MSGERVCKNKEQVIKSDPRWVGSVIEGCRQNVATMGAFERSRTIAESCRESISSLVEITTAIPHLFSSLQPPGNPRRNNNIVIMRRLQRGSGCQYSFTVSPRIRISPTRDFFIDEERSDVIFWQFRVLKSHETRWLKNRRGNEIKMLRVFDWKFSLGFPQEKRTKNL